MNKKIVFLASALALFAPLAAGAAEFRYPSRGGSGNVVVAKDETINNDLYVVGENVAIHGTVNGDVYAAGGDITVDGAVNGNLEAVGGTITLTGSIGHSLRIAGGDLKLSGKVAKDAVAFGGNLTAGDTAAINGDLIEFAGTADNFGAVSGSLFARGDKIGLAGTVGGAADLAAREITVAGNTEVTGNLTTQSETAPRIANSAKVGGEVAYKVLPKSKPNYAVFAWLGFGKGIFLLIVALLLLFVLPKKAHAVVHEFEGAVGKNALWGLLAFFATLPAAIVLALTVVGLPFALALVFLYIVALYFAAAYLAIFIGFWIRRRFSKEKIAADWKDTVLGVLALWLVALIPVLGWLVEAAFLIVALGAMLRVDARLVGIIRGAELKPHS